VILDRLWVLLRGLFLIRAEGPVASFNGDFVRHAKAGSKPPPSFGEELRELEYRWERCRTNADRKAVLRAGFEDISLHHNPKPDPALRRDTQEWREAIAADPRPSRKVAKSYEISHVTVCEFRKKYGPEGLRRSIG
jgi:hypothetical protein